MGLPHYEVTDEDRVCARLHNRHRRCAVPAGLSGNWGRSFGRTHESCGRGGSHCFLFLINTIILLRLFVRHPVVARCLLYYAAVAWCMVTNYISQLPVYLFVFIWPLAARCFRRCRVTIAVNASVVVIYFFMNVKSLHRFIIYVIRPSCTAVVSANCFLCVFIHTTRNW